MKYKYKVVRNRQRISNQVLILCIEYILYNTLYMYGYKKKKQAHLMSARLTRKDLFRFDWQNRI